MSYQDTGLLQELAVPSCRRSCTAGQTCSRDTVEELVTSNAIGAVAESDFRDIELWQRLRSPEFTSCSRGQHGKS